MKKCGWSEADQISDVLMAVAGENIWFDTKQSFRLVMLRQGMDPEATDELKFSELPPIDSLGSYSIHQDGSRMLSPVPSRILLASVPGCRRLSKIFTMRSSESSSTMITVPNSTPRNWAALADATPEQAAMIRFFDCDTSLAD